MADAVGGENDENDGEENPFWRFQGFILNIKLFPFTLVFRILNIWKKGKRAKNITPIYG